MSRRRSRAERRAARRGKGPAGPRSGRRGPGRSRPVVIGFALLAAAAAAWFWTRGEPAAPPPPPGATFHTTADGATVARLDLDALAAWCREQDLPPPPGLPETEGEFATELLAALHRAATERSAEAYGRIGMICESVDSHASALAYFDRATAGAPADHRWPYYVGCIHQVTGRSEEAASALRRAAQLDPGYPVTYARLGQLELEAGRPAVADSLFRRYTELAPHDWIGLVGSARAALANRDGAAALTLLQQAEQLGGDDFQVQRLLGRAHSLLGDRENAERHFERAGNLPQGAWYRPRDPLDEALHRSGSSVSALVSEFERRSTSQDWTGLAALAEQILRRRSGDVTMMGNLAGLYRKLGRLEEAHRVLDRAFRFGTDSVRLHNLRAEVFLAENDFPRTLEAADAVLSLEPLSARAHGARARALYMLERFEEARESMDRSLELAPDDAGNLLVRGEILLRLGDLSGAERAYQAVLRLLDHPVARQRLAEIAETRQ